MFSFKNILAITLVLGFLTLLTCMLYAFSGGVIGQTLKTSISGCDCHGFPQTPQVIVSINGPDSVNINETAYFTITMTGGPLVRGGFDIAVLNGVIDTANNLLQKFDEELTHSLPIEPIGGVVSAQFKYTAPSETGVDSIYANGNSVNFNGSAGGDQWNYSPTRAVKIVDPGRNLKLKTNLEASLLQDTLTVQVRNAISPYSIVDSKSGLGGLGAFSSFRFTATTDGTQYYIAVIHRNSIETWSSGNISFQPDSIVIYDFTVDPSSAFGSNLVNAGGLWSFYAGDVNQDGVVEGGDIVLIDNDSYIFKMGYVPTDLTYDEIVDGSDMAYSDNNAAAFITKITP